MRFTEKLLVSLELSQNGEMWFIVLKLMSREAISER